MAQERTHKHMLLRVIILVPTWLLLVAVTPFFSPAHPWHGRRFSLWDWARFATPLTMAFGGAFWLQIIIGTIGTWGIVHGHETGALVLMGLNGCFIVWFFKRLKKTEL